jgi:hypothetical protein
LLGADSDSDGISIYFILEKHFEAAQIEANKEKERLQQ